MRLPGRCSGSQSTLASYSMPLLLPVTSSAITYRAGSSQSRRACACTSATRSNCTLRTREWRLQFYGPWCACFRTVRTAIIPWPPYICACLKRLQNFRRPAGVCTETVNIHSITLGPRAQAAICNTPGVGASTAARSGAAGVVVTAILSSYPTSASGAVHLVRNIPPLSIFQGFSPDRGSQSVFHCPAQPQAALDAASKMCLNAPAGSCELLAAGVAEAAIAAGKAHESAQCQARSSCSHPRTDEIVGSPCLIPPNSPCLLCNLQVAVAVLFSELLCKPAEMSDDERPSTETLNAGRAALTEWAPRMVAAANASLAKYPHNLDVEQVRHKHQCKSRLCDYWSPRADRQTHACPIPHLSMTALRPAGSPLSCENGGAILFVSSGRADGHNKDPSCHDGESPQAVELGRGARIFT